MKFKSRRVATLALAGVAALVFWIRLGPLPEGLLDLSAHEGVRLLDRRGEPIYATLAERGGRAQRISEDDLSTTVISATLAAEDHRFFSHVGVDPWAILRAMAANARARRAVEGGSTITQQAVDLLTDDHPSLFAKFREGMLALRLEHRLGKREILGLYLSLAPYGNGRTGLVEASQFYFGVAPRDLTMAQAAYLAGLPRAPSRLNPLKSIDAARRRQKDVLARMEKHGFINEAERLRAEREPITIAAMQAPLFARHFVERVLQLPRSGGETTIHTTLAADLQREIGGIIESQRARLKSHGATAVAVAVLDNKSSAWIGWEGSGDYLGREGTIDGVITPRQPGSALKPFTYALAFERGLSPAQALPDVSSTFPTAQEGILFKPRNYDGRFHGPLLPRVALASSVNIPAIWTLSQIGVEPLLHRLRRAGFSTLTASPDFYGYGLTMGNAEVPLSEMVAAYAALARGGLWTEPRFVESDVRARSFRVFDRDSAFLVSDILADDHAREMGFGRGSGLEFPQDKVAVKTGTSQSYHDNWTVGYTGDVTVGVWVGNFNRRSLRNSSGVSGAAPIFHSVMEAALRRYRSAEGRLPFEVPAGMQRRELCAVSGGAATPHCPRRVREWLRPGTLARCRWHALNREGALVTHWPPEYVAWAREEELRGQSGRRSATRISVGLPGAPRSLSLAITSPPNGATYWIDPTLRQQFQAVQLATRGGRGAVSWRIDGRDFEPGRFPQWPLAPGRHRFEAQDTVGGKAFSEITVR